MWVYRFNYNYAVLRARRVIHIKSPSNFLDNFRLQNKLKPEENNCFKFL